jgi:hypothetical protein
LWQSSPELENFTENIVGYDPPLWEWITCSFKPLLSVKNSVGWQAWYCPLRSERG